MEGIGDSMLTCVINLTDAPSGMAVWGFPNVFAFGGAGSASIFAGGVPHMTVSDAPGDVMSCDFSAPVVKLSLFFH